MIFAVWTLLGVTYFTSGDVLAERDWFGIVLGCLLVTTGIAGIWRALRLGVVIGGEGVRVRGFDSRDQVTPWSAIQSVDCLQIDVRGGLPLYAPVLRHGDDAGAMPLSALGSYSRQDAERKVEQLRSLKASAERS
ncbi:PH domain-containing protein [Micromonospora ureilytica]|uniref:PH domain-containing protein n=1 Tax=Micromonospora ureilytica TaxID=709868 RepID=UPI0033E0229E